MSFEHTKICERENWRVKRPVLRIDLYKAWYLVQEENLDSFFQNY